MKRPVFYRALLLVILTNLGLSSCSSEEVVTKPSTVAAASVALRTPEAIAFQNALIVEIKNRSKTDFNKSETSQPMNLNENAALIAAANDFLKASGHTQEELQSRTQGNGANIISMALKVYAGQSRIETNN